MQEDWMKQVKEAKSPEEIMAIAKAHDYPLTMEDAVSLYQSIHTSGEISDEELDTVSGGGCTSKTKVKGKSYTVVTMYCKCFTGKHEPGFEIEHWDYGDVTYGKCLRTDNVSLRTSWKLGTYPMSEICGNCKNLEFKAGTGYCGKS